MKNIILIKKVKSKALFVGQPKKLRRSAFIFWMGDIDNHISPSLVFIKVAIGERICPIETTW